MATGHAQRQGPEARGPRVVLLTFPSVFGAQIINTLGQQPGLQLVGVGLSSRIDPKRGYLAGVNAFRRRSGWRYFWYSAITTDISWHLLRISGRPQVLRGGKIDVQYLPDVNSSSSLNWLDRLAPDYIISDYFNQWIGSKVRSRARTACWNVHSSRLPALRGPDPVFRALERGLTTTGVTIHEVADQIDAGRILDQQSVEIPPGLTAFGLCSFLIQRGADRLAQVLSGASVSIAIGDEDPPVAEYSSFPTPAEVSRFVERGNRLFTVPEWWRALAQLR